MVPKLSGWRGAWPSRLQIASQHQAKRERRPHCRNESASERAGAVPLLDGSGASGAVVAS